MAHYVPPEVYTNAFFEERLDTSDEWIRTRTGIRERRFAFNAGTSTLMKPAAEKAMERRGLGKDDIDIVICATVTPDHVFPSTACILQDALGLTNCWGFDISAACSGFLFALQTARSLVESGAANRILLCGGDRMSAIIDMEDRTTSVLFGDGAGAVIVEADENPDTVGIADSVLHIDGAGKKFLFQPAGGSVKPPSADTVENREHYVKQDGKTVFKAAVVGMAEVTVDIMERNNLSADDVAWLVPHQANLRIIDATRERMGLDPNKVMINIDRLGNTTAGTIPICLSEWYEQGRLNKGDKLILSSFGAGYTWGSLYLRWEMPNHES